ncbi:MAG: DegT/DnrJ/EryC1/StrS family aminotransferase [Candidatus Levybacteria bacterium]|nr:DegT/DnrJ/EryC1/StrS family aminotransferase [Candidatus Levybacteria bacterium]
MKQIIPQVYPYFTKDEEKEVLDTLRNAWVTEGPKAKSFISEMLKITGSKYGVLAPNGTLALYMSLMVLGIGPGDEIIVPDFTMIASSNAVYLTGATPIFVDVKIDDLNIDTDKIEKVITKKTKAIMPVHIYGAACDIDIIQKIAKKNKLFIVEDACQGHGLFYKNKHVGTIGDLGCFSFFADKAFTTGGEGGMVVTNDKRLYEKLLYFRNQGRLTSGSFIHPQIGYNFRMTDLQCAVGLAQIKKFDKILKKRLENHSLYEKYLVNLKNVEIIKPLSYSSFTPFRFNIFVQNLPGLTEFLQEKGIQTREMFYPLHKQPCYKMYKYNDQNFPNSIYAYKNGLSLPVYYELKKGQIKYICDAIKKFYAQAR